MTWGATGLMTPMPRLAWHSHGHARALLLFVPDAYPTSAAAASTVLGVEETERKASVGSSSTAPGR